MWQALQRALGFTTRLLRIGMVCHYGRLRYGGLLPFFVTIIQAGLNLAVLGPRASTSASSWTMCCSEPGSAFELLCRVVDLHNLHLHRACAGAPALLLAGRDCVQHNSAPDPSHGRRSASLVPYLDAIVYANYDAMGNPGA